MELDDLQVEVSQWADTHFPEVPSWRPLLGVGEEVGELNHAYLKRADRIRLDEDHDEHIKDAVGDIVIFLMHFCHREGISLEACVRAAWDQVKLRDWNAHRRDHSNG